MLRSLWRGVAVAAALAVVAACSEDSPGGSGAAVPGVTDTTIVVGTHQPLTGRAAAGYSKISAATKAYFEYVNSKGGVHGRKIEYKVVDDAYDPAKTQQVVRQLVLQDKVFAILNGLGTPTHSGVLDFLKTNKVPDLFVSSGSALFNQPSKYPDTFGFNVDYVTEAKVLANYVKKTFPGRKVCFFGQNDDFGADALRGVETVLGPVAVSQKYVPTNPNVAPQVGALKAAGCQVNVLATITPFTALTIGTAAKLGYRAQWVGSSVGGDFTGLSALLGKPAGVLLEGYVTSGYLPSPLDDANPWTKLFKDVNAKFNGNATFEVNTLFGMAVGYTFVQALQAAGEDLTRESLISAVEKGGFAGPSLVPMRYGKDDHSGFSGTQISVIRGGKQAFVDTPYVTDTGNGPVEPHPADASVPPADGIPTA
ncbi:ABC transporter substrate-binding protein [Cryptosporangium phraense]|uniref:ABC transporter substrate-binding protein n=1 Tax=Cryptosporangium phraense TaxID=2593070 RepID=A0A545AFZ0_9ACTN|nr:ABC transporter substrate-binding protein [Cryptosporangium phraense]TQS40248.1 ABC transporter substrate-binding protein [Cryptosporangium phraense]